MKNRRKLTPQFKLKFRGVFGRNWIIRKGLTSILTSKCSH